MGKNPNEVADQLERQKKESEALAQVTAQLYTMECFETLTQPNGQPIAMRVPGGWIFYTPSGGGGLSLITGEGNDEQQLIGQIKPQLHGVFVPRDPEFAPRSRQGSPDAGL